MPKASAVAGERDVHALALESGALLHVRKPRLQLFQRGFDLAAFEEGTE